MLEAEVRYPSNVTNLRNLSTVWKLTEGFLPLRLNPQRGLQSPVRKGRYDYDLGRATHFGLVSYRVY